MSSVMFINRDLIEAFPMTYGEYLEEVDQEASENIDPDTPGYVIYLDDDMVQWVEAEAFEESNMEIGSLEGLEAYQQRLLVERAIVRTNFNKLQKSLGKNTFLVLPHEMRELLKAQSRAMARYLEVLDKRCNLFLH